MIGPEGEAGPSGKLWDRRIGCPEQRGWLTFGDAVRVMVHVLAWLAAFGALARQDGGAFESARARAVDRLKLAVAFCVAVNVVAALVIATLGALWTLELRECSRGLEARAAVLEARVQEANRCGAGAVSLSGGSSTAATTPAIGVWSGRGGLVTLTPGSATSDGGYITPPSPYPGLTEEQAEAVRENQRVPGSRNLSLILTPEQYRGLYGPR